MRRGLTREDIRIRYRREWRDLCMMLRFLTRKRLSRAIGISAGYLSDILNHNRAPGPSVLQFLEEARQLRKGGKHGRES